MESNQIVKRYKTRQRIIDAMTRHGEYLAAHIGPEREGKLPVGRSSNYHRGMNSLSVLEPIVLLYELTGKQTLLHFADYLVEEGSEEIGGIFRLAAEDKLYPYQYPHTKAYEMTSCFEGLLEYARVTGKKEKLQAVINFAYRALEAEISVIGCAGSIHEYFDHTNARHTSFFYKGAMQETCVTVTWMKFCARMLAVTGDPIFADAFEQSLENAYYGALNIHENLNTDQIGVKHHVPGVGVVPRVLPFDSYSPLLLGRRGKGIGGLQTLRDGDYYGCCACIGSAGIGIAPRLSVLPTETGFGVYLYTDTTVQTKTPSGNRIAFVFSGNYPVNGSIRLVVCPEQPEAFDLALRVPSWSEKTAVTVNDEPVPVTPGMTVIKREWGINDVVRVTFDLRVEALRPAHYGTDTVGIPVKNHSMVEWHTDTETPENHAFVALRRGPLMLARDARLNEGFAPVRLDAETDAYVEADVASAGGLSFPARCRLTVHGADGSRFTAVDYASAGKTWSDDSQCEVWLPKA